jgi:transcriptional regulator with PAS, ATPase and Fis domain
MEQILLSWIGQADLNGSTPAGAKKYGEGPIVNALRERDYDYVRLLINYKDQDLAALKGWYRKYTKAKVELVHVPLKDPTDFEQIYRAAVENIETCSELFPKARLTIHATPGTPAMQHVWIILTTAKYEARLITSSREQGVKTASIPFDIAAEFIPNLVKKRDQRITDQFAGTPLTEAGFEALTYRSSIMARLVDKASRVALHSVPVLIEGESGTGKEVLAHSIHKASPRADEPFVAVNCGSIPSELIESQLFGHKKGGFTGATQDHKGFFEVAGKGTIFLDEVGELPLPAQVKLLRVLEDRSFTPIGAEKPQKVEARIIAATNRSLISEVHKGDFREDLFFRLAIATLKLPPLRDREGDMTIMINELMKSVQTNMLELKEENHKTLSVNARKIFLDHDWPGNVRELRNTIARAVLWSNGDEISAEDAREAILVNHASAKQDLLALPLDNGFSLSDLLAKIEKHYVLRALEEAHWKKTAATEKLGLNSYQNLTQRMQKYGIE